MGCVMIRTWVDQRNQCLITQKSPLRQDWKPHSPGKYHGKFIKGKSCVLHLGWDSSGCVDRLGNDTQDILWFYKIRHRSLNTSDVLDITAEDCTDWWYLQKFWVAFSTHPLAGLVGMFLFHCCFSLISCFSLGWKQDGVNEKGILKSLFKKTIVLMIST